MSDICILFWRQSFNLKECLTGRNSRYISWGKYCGGRPLGGSRMTSVLWAGTKFIISSIPNSALWLYSLISPDYTRNWDAFLNNASYLHTGKTRKNVILDLYKFITPDGLEQKHVIIFTNIIFMMTTAINKCSSENSEQELEAQAPSQKLKIVSCYGFKLIHPFYLVRTGFQSYFIKSQFNSILKNFIWKHDTPVAQCTHECTVCSLAKGINARR